MPYDFQRNHKRVMDKADEAIRFLNQQNKNLSSAIRHSFSEREDINALNIHEEEGPRVWTEISRGCYVRPVESPLPRKGYSVQVGWLNNGATIERHKHPSHEEVVMVVAGSMIRLENDEEMDVSSPPCTIARGEWHSFKSINGHCEFIVLFRPPLQLVVDPAAEVTTITQDGKAETIPA